MKIILLIIAALAGCHNLDPAQVGYEADLAKSEAADSGATLDLPLLADQNGPDRSEADQLVEADLAKSDLLSLPDLAQPDLVPPPPSCNDGAKNQDETDVDCGGAKCAKCADGKICKAPLDCQNGGCGLINGQSGLCTGKGRVYFKITILGDAQELRYSFNGMMESHPIGEFMLGKPYLAPTGVTSGTFHTVFQGKVMYATQVSGEVYWANGKTGNFCIRFNNAHDFASNTDLVGFSADSASPCNAP